MPGARSGSRAQRADAPTWVASAYTLAALLCALVPSGGMLIAMRALQGIARR
jgi:MFS family permease